MADTVRIELDLRRLERIDDELRGVLGQVVQKTALDVEAHAKALMEGPKTGRIYKRGKGKTHQASAPGQAPAVDSGNLKGGIQARPTGALTAEVDVAAPYGPVLEFGGAKVAPRPFLTPAVEAVAEGFKAAVTSAVRRKLEG